MRFSRHAKNNARDLEVTIEEAERAIHDSLRVDADYRGRPRYTSYIRHMRVRIVVALDEPDLIVTIHERRN